MQGDYVIEINGEKFDVPEKVSNLMLMISKERDYFCELLIRLRKEVWANNISVPEDLLDEIHAAIKVQTDHK